MSLWSSCSFCLSLLWLLVIPISLSNSFLQHMNDHQGILIFFLLYLNQITCFNTWLIMKNKTIFLFIIFWSHLFICFDNTFWCAKTATQRGHLRWLLQKLARQKTIAEKETITDPSSLASMNFLAIRITLHSYALIRGEWTFLTKLCIRHHMLVSCVHTM